MIYLSNDPYPQEISIPRSFGVIVPQRKVYLTEDDIAANLETDSDREVLAASQGVALKRMVDEKADADDVYTKSQVDNALAEKQDTLTPGENIRIENNVISAVVPEVDAYTKQETDELLSQKADKSDIYTKEQVDTALAEKANASDIPTKTSDLDNDSGFVTGQEVSQTYETKQDATDKQTALQTAIAGKQDTLESGVNIKTINGESLLGGGNINIQAEPEIFWAEYGVTTFQAVDDAVRNGKVVYVERQDLYFRLNFRDSSGDYRFEAVVANTIYAIICRQNNTWSDPAYTLEQVANRSQSVPTDRTSTTKYPSVKAVFDSLGKWGIVSQTQTWTGNTTVLSTYTMSNIVRGLIPQAAIDMYENAGAVFNESTGYFEMNGLTDLSYNEIKAAYDFSYRNNGIFEDISNLPIRTNFPLTDGVKLDSGPATYRRGISLSLYYLWNFENFEVFRATRDTSKALQLSNYSNYLFYNSDRLREVQGIIGVYNLTGTLGYFFRNYVIEKVHLYDLRANWDMRRSAYFALESIVYAVDHSANGATVITITLHPTAYARCQADTTEYTYNGQTYTGILAFASAKNITIASA